jgi:hypothetical protein
VRNDDDDSEEEYLTATDIDGNAFVIKGDGRQVFYKSAKTSSGVKKCRRCEDEKRDFHVKHFGERWLVVNRDMTGSVIKLVGST